MSKTKVVPLIKFAYWRVPRHCYDEGSKGPTDPMNTWRWSRKFRWLLANDPNAARYLPNSKPTIDPHEKGGLTRCQLFDPETKKVVAEGWSNCSYTDSFSYQIGRDLAYARAMENLSQEA